MLFASAAAAQEPRPEDVLREAPPDVESEAIDELDRSLEVEESPYARWVEAVTGRRLRAHFPGGRRLFKMSGANLAPGCLADATSGPSAIDLLACFLDLAAEVLTVDGEDVRGSAWEVRRTSPQGNDGFWSVSVQQKHDGFDVRRAGLALSIRNGKLVGVSGRREAPSKLRWRETPRSETQVVSALEAASEHEVTLVAREFDTVRGSVVVTYFDNTNPVLLHLMDESTNEELKTWSREEGLDYVTRPTDVWQPTSTNDWVTDTAVVENVALPVGRMSELESLLLLCPIGTCAFIRDAGTDLEDGEPWTVGDDAPPVECHSCTSSNQRMFLGDMSPPSSEALTTNAHFWVHDLAAFANHWRAAYDDWTPWTNADNVEVELPLENPCEEPGIACARDWPPYNDYELILPQAEFAQGDVAPQQLWIIAHEYGHVLHYLYDWHGSEFTGNSVDEGFADHNVLRYGMFRWREQASRSFDVITALTRDSSIPGQFSYRAFELYSNGEARPFVSSDPDRSVFSTAATTACGAEADYVACGSLLPMIYWELAWNELIASYDGSTAGESILDQSAYQAQPERLANVAFTYAVAQLGSGPSDAGLDDFFWWVHDRYAAFEEDGWINYFEFDRVTKLLASHCLGWNGSECSTWHRTAWHRLPQARTTKSTFATTSGSTNPEHFVLARDMTRLGDPPVYPFNGPDPAEYIRLHDGDDQLTLILEFPQSGQYKFHGAVQAGSVAGDSLWVQIDNQAQQAWIVESAYIGSWFFSHNGPVFTVSAGSHTIKLRYREPINLEAILVRKL
ncbi:MAG: hypothetical protein HYV07_15305 [Deltaproteobacteria bacterium]|nr:hypothetical protein [Deltaproteobacteria bacterium]